ncbi:MAG: HutD family protein [Rhizobiaceae bacterium]|nr:HutD family protein [Rhizobiaceae bacterium]
MRVLRAADYEAMPWKNGGGITSQIATYPEAAGLDDFLWRLSMARVEVDGPFSTFAGVDRSLALVEGDGLVLSVGVHAPVALRQTYDPLPFAGDESTGCALIGGPITDLNIMTRRGRASHVMRSTRLGAGETLQLALGNRLVFCAEGQVSLDDGGDEALLDRFDTLDLCADDGMVRLTALQPSVLLVTELYLIA